MRFPEGLSLKASAALKIIFSVYPQMFFLKKRLKKKKKIKETIKKHRENAAHHISEDRKQTRMKLPLLMLIQVQSKTSLYKL